MEIITTFAMSKSTGGRRIVAPQRAAFFMPVHTENAIAAPRLGSGNTPEGFISCRALTTRSAAFFIV